mmetsp:Transcript_45596/g.125983  ORF Transcript_45596/g.125983 Transcript_45596/m.125983 type:complete len:112 (+) Transcript_45596:869-1204(+)
MMGPRVGPRGSLSGFSDSSDGVIEGGGDGDDGDDGDAAGRSSDRSSSGRTVTTADMVASAATSATTSAATSDVPMGVGVAAAGQGGGRVAANGARLQAALAAERCSVCRLH